MLEQYSLNWETTLVVEYQLKNNVPTVVVVSM